MNQQNITQDQAKKDCSGYTCDTLSLLSYSKGGVLLNPNGTLLHMQPAIQNIKKQKQNSFDTYVDQQILLPVFGDDELAFFVNRSDLPNFVEDVLEALSKHSKIFIIFLFICLVTESLFDYLTYYNQELQITQLQEVYTGMTAYQVQMMFTILFYTDIIFCIFYYILGFIAAAKKNLNLLNYFASFALFGLILEIILTYINKFNFVIFFFRILAYIYAKFLGHLLLNLLLLPR